MRRFETYIGIDYSSARTPSASLPGLRAYLAEDDGQPKEVLPLTACRSSGLPSWRTSSSIGLPTRRSISILCGTVMKVTERRGGVTRAGGACVRREHARSRSFDRGGRTADQQDAYCIAAWLSRADQRGSLRALCEPELPDQDRTTAPVEGWILGV